MITLVGSYGVGLTMRSPRIPVAGETISDGAFSSSHGGKGSNQAVAAARLGSKVAILTAVGEDKFGDSALDLWRSEGIDVSAVVRTSSPTMVGVILVDRDGENRIVIAPGALSDLTPAHVADFEATIAASQLLVVSLEIPLEVAAAALEVAHRHGVRTLLNPAPAQRIPDEMWSWIDVLTPNASEARTMLGLAPDAPVDDDELVDRLRAVCDGVIVMTLGGHGALVDDGSARYRVPPVTPRAVVDTTGAGDTFTGALAHALEQGQKLAAAVRLAAAAGSYAVGIAEVIPSIPHAEELEAFMHAAERVSAR